MTLDRITHDPGHTGGEPSDRPNRVPQGGARAAVTAEPLTGVRP